MAKLRYSPATGLFEWEGTTEELVHIYDYLIERENTNTQRVTRNRHLHGFRVSDLELMGKMPTSDALFEYVLSKPRYEHDIKQVGEAFFGKQIKAREYPNLYRKLSYELEKVRKRIEKEKNGAFEQKKSTFRNLKKYIFKPLSRSLLSTYEQRPS
ncbi:hypothetical protein HXY33_00810 [Candidatus Bathyarchaeota archaeon]|nr:hypothetical protein [Candidatus Bathyarchaeota archaeon]